MKKVKVGVIGAYRGSSMINYCKGADNAEIVAICDKNTGALEAQRQNSEGLNITFYQKEDGNYRAAAIKQGLKKK